MIHLSVQCGGKETDRPSARAGLWAAEGCANTSGQLGLGTLHWSREWDRVQ